MPNYKNKIIRISAVKYINTLPFIYGIRKRLKEGTYFLDLDTPAVCAEKLITDRTDVGLVPVASLREIKNCKIISKYCIAAEGAVKSVKLFSRNPLHKIKNILLDKNSMTSVALAKILARNFWKIQPEWLPGSDNAEKKITGTTAAVIIGDKALAMEGMYPYEYDLALEWHKWTGLPFVFACWATNKKLNASFITNFEKAMAYGLKNINKALIEYAGEISGIMTLAQVHNYLYKNINFKLDHGKRKAMELFLTSIHLQ